MRGLNTDDAALVLTMTRRVGASLRNYRDKGTIRSIKDGQYGKYDLRSRSSRGSRLFNLWERSGGNNARVVIRCRLEQDP